MWGNRPVTIHRRVFPLTMKPGTEIRRTAPRCRRRTGDSFGPSAGGVCCRVAFQRGASESTVMMRIRKVSFLLTALGTLLFCQGALAANVLVKMSNFAFTPNNAAINAGDSVTWTNTGFTGHNTTSEAPAQPNLWASSPSFSTPGTFTFTFTNAGSYPYECTIHVQDGMTGSVTVSAPSGSSPPTITQQPANVTTNQSSTVTFTVGATGTAPLLYQWQFNNTNLPGATNATLTITNVQTNQAGNYLVVVGNVAGTATSSNVVLAVQFSEASAQSVYTPYTFTTLAGSAGQSGSADGTGNAARFDAPEGVVVDKAGNIYLVDSNNETLRKATPSGTNWVVRTLAGLADTAGSADGTGSAARFNGPFGLALDNAGNLYVADRGNDTIRKVTTDGTNWSVTTLAGLAGNAGTADGTGSAARFNFPYGLAVDGAGNVYVADTQNHTIRQVTPAGVVTTIAGFAGISGSADGNGTDARFKGPMAPAVDSLGNVIVLDQGNFTVRRMTPDGTNWVVTTLAGLAGDQGFADGTGTNARFSYPDAVAVDDKGNIYVADTQNFTIRRVTATGVVTTIAGVPGLYGSMDGTGSFALFYNPEGVAVDSAGNIYVTDQSNDTIRKGFSANVQPTITQQPASVATNQGATVTFTVVATGTPPLGYQWQFNNTNLPGATNAVLTLANVQTSQAGSYSVVVGNVAGTTTSSGGELTVLSPLSVSWAIPPSIVYGTALSAAQLDATANTVGTFKYSPPLGTVLPAGSGQALSVTFTPADSVDYPPFTTNIVINVQPAPLSVTANNATRLFGDPNPGFTASITGLVNGDTQSVISGSPSLSTAASQASTPGSYPITVSQGTLSAANYGFANFVNGTLNITGLSLTVVTNGLGGVQINPTQTNYADGTLVVLTATPFTNWVFAGWTGAVVTNTNVVTVVMSSNVLMTANFLPTYPVTLTTNGQGTLSISPAQTQYVSNAVVTVTASPASGWGFAGWSGSMTTNALTITLPVNQALNLTGTFLPVWQITATPSGQGTVAATPNPPYLDGTIVSLTATPATGWTFAGWTGGVTSAANLLNLTLTTNLNVTAVFKQLFTVTGQVVGQGQVGIVPSQMNYVDGTTVVVTATPAAGWAFTGWSGSLSGQANPASLLVTGGNQSVTATFKHLWNFTASAGAGGTVNWAPQQTNYLDGTTVTVTAVASNGFAFSQWTGAASGNSNPLSLTLSGNEQVQASFIDIQPPVVTIATPAAGTVTNGSATLSGTLTDNVGVATAQWSFNGGAWQSISNAGGGTFGVANVPLKIGTNVFAVEATDAAGNVGSNTVQVVYAPNRILTISNALPVQEGERAVFALSLISGGEVSGINFGLAYDTNYLADPQVVWSAIAGESINTVNTQALGVVQAVLSLPGTMLPAGIQALAAVSFRARSVPFTLNSIVTPSIQDVASQSGAGFVSGNATQPGSAQITQRLIIGDNNANQILDIGDAVIIEQMLVGLMEVRSWDVALNDVNGNGILDSGDVIKVLRAVVGLDPQPASVEPGPGSGGFTKSLTSRREAETSALVNSNDVAVLQFPDGSLPAVGQPYHVVVYISQLAGLISGLSFDLNYPTNALQLELNTVGGLIPNQTVPLWNLVPGEANLAVIGASAWPNTNGVAATFTFLALPGLTNAPNWPLTLTNIQVTGTGYDIRSLDPVNAVVEGMNGALAAPVLAVTGVNRVAGNLSLSVAAGVGTIIVVQTSTNLINWLPYGSPVTGQGANVAVPVPLTINTNERARFYRLQGQ
jgi:plastocyanin